MSSLFSNAMISTTIKATTCVLFLSLACHVQAQDVVLKRGDAIVTGFSGTTATTPPDIEETFIDLARPSMQIFPLQPDGPPNAQLLPSSPAYQAKARDIGQVFAIGLDDGLKPRTIGATPNIYLGATSAFGLQIVLPDADGDGRPERIKAGFANAEWVPGQWGPNGGPGSIWKIDGTTGAPSLFATLPGNSGPGVGDIVYDAASLHFYASDLDTGLIHRIDAAGNLIDTFDHGSVGRQAAGLGTIADDGATADIRNPAFDSQDAKTWGFTQPERQVWGLGVTGGRLYYSTADGPSIWSVSLGLEGSFGSDARREFEVSGTPGNRPISDIAFDAQGLMYIAQRGGFRGSYDYTAFTEAKSSVVFRYKRETPDDPATPGVWVPVPEEFAIGFPPDHRNTNGGIALGYGYDETGRTRGGMCNAMLWSTGESLRLSTTDADKLAAGGPAVVHGIQGSDRMLVRPDNEPPFKTYFLDYDGRHEDPEHIGYLGDVEIWQPCDTASYGYGYPYAPYPYVPPYDDWPSDYNLEVEKSATPFACVPGGAGFLCSYTVRVTNTGPDPYIGPITLNDQLLNAPAGASMFFNDPPWECTSGTPTDYHCLLPQAVLWPGSSVDLKVTVDTPVPAPVCAIDNFAQLTWPWGDTKSWDNMATATVGIPAAHCPPVPNEQTNLKISKGANPICVDRGGHFECSYVVTVTNLGPATYNGAIKIDETLPAGTTATFNGAKWNCSNAAPYSCTHDPDVLGPGDSRHLHVTVDVPNAQVGPLACKAPNKAALSFPASPSSQNTNPGDDTAIAIATLPGTAQQCPDLKLSNLKITKSEATGKYCAVVGNNWECKFNITVQNFGQTMNNEVQFVEALGPGTPAGTTVTFQTPGNWQCNASFFPQTVCKSPNPGLGHMDKVEILATVKIPIGPTQQCSIKNTASISKPGAPSAQNTFGGDDSAKAWAFFETVNPVNGAPYCAHPPGPPPVSPAKTEPNLAVTKTAGAPSKTASGQSIPYVITVTNNGPGTFGGALVVLDKLSHLSSGISGGAPLWDCQVVPMSGPPDDVQCTYRGPPLKPGDSASLNLAFEMSDSAIAQLGSACTIKNEVSIVQPAAGTPQNVGNTSASATTNLCDASAPPPPTSTPPPPPSVTPPPPPPAPSCPQGWSATPVAGKCCPPNSAWNGARCDRGGPPPRDDKPPRVTPPPRDDKPPRVTPPPRDSKPPRVTPPTRDDKPPRKEPPRKEPPRKEPPRKEPPRKAPPEQKPPRAEPPRPQCPQGTIGQPPNCKTLRELIGKCPKGMSGKPPDCVPKEKRARGQSAPPPNAEPPAKRPVPPIVPDQ